MYEPEDVHTSDLTESVKNLSIAPNAARESFLEDVTCVSRYLCYPHRLQHPMSSPWQPGIMTRAIEKNVTFPIPTCKPVYLHEVGSLWEELESEVSSHWPMAFIVTEQSSATERRLHLLSVGGMYIENVKPSKMPWPDVPSGIVRDIFRKYARERPIDNYTALFFMWGLVRNSALRSMFEHPGERFAWDSVLWEELEYISDKGLENEELKNLSLAMQGKPSTMSFGKVFVEIRQTNTSMEVFETKPTKLYDVLLSSTKLDVTPESFGLGLVLSHTHIIPASGTREIVIPLQELVSCVHAAALRMYLFSLYPGRQYETGHEEEFNAGDFPGLVEFLYSTLGSIAMQRILLSCLYYLEDNYDEKLDCFSKTIEAANVQELDTYMISLPHIPE